MNFRIPTKSKDLVQHLNGETNTLLNVICVFDEQERKTNKEKKKNERGREGREEERGILTLKPPFYIKENPMLELIVFLS